ALPLHEIEAIEIIAGSESVQYGDQAVGGIVHILTRQSDKEQIILACQTGSYHQYQCYVMLQRQLKLLNVNLTATKSHTDNYRDHNAYQQNRLSGQVYYPYARGSIQLDLTAADEDMQYPGALTAAQARQNRQQASNTTDFFDNKNGVFQLKHQHSHLVVIPI
ncbi:MAG TPA: hypothetical protein VHZ76_10805, partial [Gammaproteobacteria bacterium]|nr:hypothetical protein [Gammaproteobacteria bacterium]